MEDSWCSGLLKGDPDIAGVGVVLGIWIANTMSVVAGVTLWYLTVVKGTSLGTSQFGLRVLKCAFSLSDTAFVTMIAVVCSSIVLIKSRPNTSLYHVFIARCLAQTCQIGVFCSVPYYDYVTLSQRGTVGARLRYFLYVCAIGLWIYWTLLCISEFESQNWHSVTPSCFYNDSVIRGSYTFWMKLDVFWTPCSWLWYLLEVWPQLEGFLKTLNKLVPSFPERATTRWRRWYGRMQSPSTGQALRINVMVCLRLVGGAVYRGAFDIVDIVTCFLVSVFVGPPSTSPIVNIGLLIWSIYDLKIVWQANKDIVVECPPNHNAMSLQGNTNPESDWGFGQLLPMFLLLLPILSVVDSFE